MKHGKLCKKLNRSPSHRQALNKNLILSLIQHGKIITTKPKSMFVLRKINGIINGVNKIEKHELKVNFIKKHVLARNKDLINLLIKNCEQYPQKINHVSRKLVFTGRADGANTVELFLLK